MLEVRRESCRGGDCPARSCGRERLADAVRRSPADQGGVEGVAPHQLRVFDDRSATIAAGYCRWRTGPSSARPPGLTV